MAPNPCTDVWSSPASSSPSLTVDVDEAHATCTAMLWSGISRRHPSNHNTEIDLSFDGAYQCHQQAGLVLCEYPPRLEAVCKPNQP